MELKQIATILNTTIVPNILGEETTIAEDLSNIVDLGTAVSSISADTMKDYMKQFAVGVAKTYFEGKTYGVSDLGLYRDAQDFGGAIQRIKMSISNFAATDSHIYTLENGTDYFDGTYHGVSADAKIYTKDDAYKVPWSIPHEMYKQIFMSADQVGSFVSLITNTLDNAITVRRHGLAKSVVNKMITGAYADSRVYHLVTQFNATHDQSAAVTTATALNSPEFLRWSAMQIKRLYGAMTEMSKKYNDGTIETFTDLADVRICLLDQFDSAIAFNMESDTYHMEKVSIGKNYNTVPFWQNASTDLIPNMGAIAEIKEVTGEETSTSYSNIVGVVFDYYSAGITQKLDKVTTQYIGSEDYTNFYHHIVDRYFIDSRNNAVVLALD